MTMITKQKEKKRIRISQKRQITIPQKFYEQLGFSDSAECTVKGDSLVITPVKVTSGEFADLILEDLVKEGYSGDSLVEEFRNRQRKIRPAVKELLSEAKMVAEGGSRYGTYDEIFNSEEE